MDSKLLVHLCTAQRTHIISGIDIFSFILPDINHVYIYVGAKEQDKPMYISHVSRYGNSKYFFLGKLSDIYTLPDDIKKGMILSHGFSYRDCFYLKLHGFKNVHWICWGESVVAGKSLLSRIFRPIKKFMMKKLNGIITLMGPDKERLTENYNLNNVYYISYVPCVSNYQFSAAFFEQDTVYNKVLLGNNTDCIPYHGTILDNLKKFAGRIKVDCLLNYSLIKDDCFNYLYNKGKDYFGDDFNVIETFMTQDEYIDFLKGYDVYICNMPEQTGLGAIHRCLRLGKKLFLNGANYDYVTQIGCFLNHVRDLETISFDEFISPLTKEQKVHNLNSVNTVLDYSVLTTKWNQYIKKFI